MYPVELRRITSAFLRWWRRELIALLPDRIRALLNRPADAILLVWAHKNISVVRRCGRNLEPLFVTSTDSVAGVLVARLRTALPRRLVLHVTREILLAGAQVGAQNDAFSFRDYTRYNGQTLSEADKERIVSLIDAGGVALGAEAGVGALAAAHGRWSLATQTQAVGEGTLPRDLARLVLFGNIENETYSVAGATGCAAAWSAAQLSYSAPLWRNHTGWRVTGGVTAKLLHGWASAEVVRADGTLTTTIDAIQGGGEFLLRTARGGSGYGCDLGVAARHGNHLTLSLALTDALSRLEWNDTPELRHATFTANDVSLVDADQLDDVLSDSTWTEPTAAFTSRLPRRLTFGAAFPLGRRLEVSAALTSRFGGGFAGRTRGSLGLVYPLGSVLALGGGLAVGGAGTSSASTGLLVQAGPARLDLAVAARGSALFWQARGYGVALGLGFAY